ncbi:MAG: hypothetical protein V7K26_24135 [Nostoc sp.]|uniref:hypothetical protein n=1 Tax=Nostoc sp. TaxID=1180 RepID=UPI002FEEEC1F
MLSKVGSTSESILHDALPYLLGFFQKDEQFPRGEFLSLYYSLLELLLLLRFLEDFQTSLKFTQYFEQMQRAIAPQKTLT